MPDLDVIESGAPPWRPRGWVAIGILAVAAVVVGYLVHRSGDRPSNQRSLPSRTVAAKSSISASIPAPACPAADDSETYPASAADEAVGLALTPSHQPTGAISRRDLTADTSGPWTVIIRAAGGTMGTRSAVLTYPVSPTTDGTLVAVGPATGRLKGGRIVWSLGGSFARIRGDLLPAEVISIAAQTHLANDRPIVGPVAGFTSSAVLPYRAPLINESRYGGGALGPSGEALGGLVYGGVLRAGGFEDRLFETSVRTGVAPVHGKSAVLSAVLGGNATLAWELAPGVVAYVGFSGTGSMPAATCALVQLARGSRLIAGSEWTGTGVDVIDDVNDFA